MLSTPAQALPLHRIAASMRYAAPRFAGPRFMKLVEKPLSAAEGSAWIASRARNVATRTGTIGWCYKAVKTSLKPFGILLKGGAAWMASQQLLSDGRFQTASMDDLKPGDILVHGRSAGHPYGHIAVYLGNLEEASDHVQALVNTAAYGGTMVFRLKSSISFMVAVAKPRTAKAQA